MQGVPLLEKVYRFRGFSFFVFLVFDSLLSWLLGFLVSKTLGFLVSKFQRFTKSPCHVFC